jgi:AhpD family alkylhydroperoxidase
MILDGIGLVWFARAMDYQQSSDLRLAPVARGLAKAEFDAFMTFHETALRPDGMVPKKYRELIALAVATATKCAYCIETHTRGAAAAGATREEMIEASFVAAAVHAGGVMAHSLLALRLHDETDASTPAHG